MPRSVGIVGAGPTGLALALMLVRQGRRVVVHERFDEPRPIGAGFMLQPTGLSVLDHLGLSERVKALGQPLEHIFGREARRRRVVLDVRYSDLKSPRPDGVNALGVHRAAIFQVLYEACLAEGVAFETSREIDSASDGRLTDAQGVDGPAFDLIVDASGARSPIARDLLAKQRGRRHELEWGALWTTVPWPGQPFDEGALEQVYRGASRMVGVLPVGARPGSPDRLATFFWSLKPRDHDDWLRAGMERWKAEVRGLWPEVAGLLETLPDAEALTLARYGHHTLPLPIADHLAVVGDAAHSTSPQLGQGVNMGLLDAFVLAETLATHAELDEALTAYARIRRWHVRLYQALSMGFTPFYQADGQALPWVRDHVLGKLARLPFAARILAATVSGVLLDPRG
ncbi:NAD(P)/FAD-dependent oxidoreductase [Brevundimonas sp. NIBR11]|uniref:FAD-dependent oxidoreductase n=1 Tax=Brevundimonas sp. NIBR11 TaxID=3015999 RepID=UPI0022F05CAF|nr:NAD(P)/FAD-dependent oxidoreductase [Brevundimonas sp. NIBR11]WGM32442.1 FAD-dependent urate hydroxylase [Brevundimonas sp. NIBR11]